MATPKYLIEAQLYTQRSGRKQNPQGEAWASTPEEIDGLSEALVFTADTEPSQQTQQELRRYVNKYADWALFQRKSPHEQYLQANKPEKPTLPSGISVKHFRD